jgi:hypothetical protein
MDCNSDGAANKNRVGLSSGNFVPANSTTPCSSGTWVREADSNDGANQQFTPTAIATAAITPYCHVASNGGAQPSSNPTNPQPTQSSNKPNEKPKSKPKLNRRVQCNIPECSLDVGHTGLCVSAADFQTLLKDTPQPRTVVNVPQHLVVNNVVAGPPTFAELPITTATSTVEYVWMLSLFHWSVQPHRAI